ncbi:MAG TPA: methyltransferase domain-containing protein [Vicinamibacterales bacterium]|nr:methyltransferase domain-containing protein [Vicinamibacterales bacterium]
MTVQRKTLAQTAWDFIGIPARLVLFPPHWLERCGWTTLEDERLRQVLPEIRGRLLDIGAGPNTLVKRYGQGTGVDVFDWGGGALVVEDTAQLPFADRSFDTIAFIACLNHIPNREAVLKEARRLLAPGGRVVMTMINPILGGVGHAIWWYSEDKQRGGMLPGEVGGLWTKDIVAMCEAAGFRLITHRRFVYGMNHLYVFETAARS